MIENNFACNCDAESRKEVQEVREWAEEYLGTSDDRLLIDRILYKLDGDYYASIKGVYVDQWGVIEVGTSPYMEKDLVREVGSKAPIEDQIEGHHVYIQFDRFIDGLVYVLKSYYDKYGDTASGGESAFEFK